MTDILNKIKDFLTECTDELIAIGVLGSGITFIYLGIEIPEFFAVILGMVAMHYFQKK